MKHITKEQIFIHSVVALLIAAKYTFLPMSWWWVISPYLIVLTLIILLGIWVVVKMKRFL